MYAHRRIVEVSYFNKVYLVKKVTLLKIMVVKIIMNVLAPCLGFTIAEN